MGSGFSIRNITVWQKTLPLREPYWLSGGRLKFEELDSTFIAIECSDGTVGWGESCPWGHTYTPAFGGGVRAALQLLAPVMLGENPLDIARLNRKLDETLPGHPYAKSCVDMALWDIAGKRFGQPLYQLFGGRHGEQLEVNSSISTGTPEQMVELIRKARDQGYRTHSAKIGGNDTALDIARINAIESACIDNEKITFDVNRAWTPAQAIKVMNSVLSRSWFEQPCETLNQCAEVKRHTPQPLMLDECLHTFGDHLEAWKMGACQGVKVKPNRLGGLSRCRQVIDFGVAVGWQMHIEDVGGTILADTAAMHLALATPEPHRLASWLSHAHLIDDFEVGKGARNVDGNITLPDAPGIGVEPPIDWLGEPAATY